MNELWIGVVEVLTDADAGAGNTRAFTNVVTWASSVPEFSRKVELVFGKYDWTGLGVENVRPVAAQSGYEEEITEIVERARMSPDACIYSTFHYYPSPPA